MIFVNSFMVDVSRSYTKIKIGYQSFVTLNDFLWLFRNNSKWKLDKRYLYSMQGQLHMNQGSNEE